MTHAVTLSLPPRPLMIPASWEALAAHALSHGTAATIVDAQGRVVATNPRAAQLLRECPAYAALDVGRCVRDCVPDAIAQELRGILRCMETERWPHVTCRTVHHGRQLLVTITRLQHHPRGRNDADGILYIGHFDALPGPLHLVLDEAAANDVVEFEHVDLGRLNRLSPPDLLALAMHVCAAPTPALPADRNARLRRAARRLGRSVDDLLDLAWQAGLTPHDVTRVGVACVEPLLH